MPASSSVLTTYWCVFALSQQRLESHLPASMPATGSEGSEGRPRPQNGRAFEARPLPVVCCADRLAWPPSTRRALVTPSGGPTQRARAARSLSTYLSRLPAHVPHFLPICNLSLPCLVKIGCACAAQRLAGSGADANRPLLSWLRTDVECPPLGASSREGSRGCATVTLLSRQDRFRPC